jgi:hypothetical protein
MVHVYGVLKQPNIPATCQSVRTWSLDTAFLSFCLVDDSEGHRCNEPMEPVAANNAAANRDSTSRDDHIALHTNVTMHYKGLQASIRRGDLFPLPHVLLMLHFKKV